MANAGVTYHLDTRELDKLAAALNGNRMDVLTAAGFEVERSAKKRAPYITGALSNSIFTKTSKENDYSEASSNARDKNENVEILSLDEFPDDENKVIIAPCVNYGIWVELGHGENPTPKPYLFPALEEIINAINQGKFWERLFKR